MLWKDRYKVVNVLFHFLFADVIFLIPMLRFPYRDLQYDDDKIDLVIDRDLSNLSTEASSTNLGLIKNAGDEQKYTGQYPWFYYNL